MYFFGLFVLLHKKRAKVLKKMHIRKQSEQYLQKKIDIYLHAISIPHSSMLENGVMDIGCKRC